MIKAAKLACLLELRLGTSVAAVDIKTRPPRYTFYPALIPERHTHERVLPMSTNDRSAGRFVSAMYIAQSLGGLFEFFGRLHE